MIISKNKEIFHLFVEVIRYQFITLWLRMFTITDWPIYVLKITDWSIYVLNIIQTFFFMLSLAYMYMYRAIKYIQFTYRNVSEIIDRYIIKYYNNFI